MDVWGPGTNWYDIKRLRRSAFRPSQEDDVVEVHIIWGLKNQDRSSCHFTDFKCKGSTVFDGSFDLNPSECQVALLVSDSSVRRYSLQVCRHYDRLANFFLSLSIIHSLTVIHSLVHSSFHPSIQPPIHYFISSSMINIQ